MTMLPLALLHQIHFTRQSLVFFFPPLHFLVSAVLCSAITLCRCILSLQSCTNYFRPCLQVHDFIIVNFQRLLEYTSLFLLISDMSQHLANLYLPRLPAANKTANTKLVHKLVLSTLLGLFVPFLYVFHSTCQFWPCTVPALHHYRTHVLSLSLLLLD
jgi:hypothetical protein